MNLHVNSFWNYRLSRLGYASRLKIGGLKGIQTLTRSLQDFYALRLHHQPEKSWCRRRDFHPHESRSHKAGLNLVRLIISPLRPRNFNTDGEIWTHITTLLRRVPLAVGLRRRKRNKLKKFGLGGWIQTCENLLPRQVRIVICGTPRKIGWRGRTRTCINFASSDSKSEMFPLHHSPLELNYLEIMISFTREKLEKAVSDSKSYAEVLRKIGLCQTGNNNQTIKKYISLWKLNVRHFSTQSERAKLYLNKPPKPLESILVRNSSYNRTNLKKRLYDATLKKPICKMCGQNENWQGKQMY